VKTVSITDLKAKLSAHIQLVKRGQEIIICERNKPVARIVPCSVEDYSEREKRLIASGVIAPARKKRKEPVSWPKPAGHVSDEVMKRIWQEEREGR
jgi:prevent-host-death family protein